MLSIICSYVWAVVVQPLHSPFNNHSRIVAITHEFSARFKAFGHDDFCWRTHTYCPASFQRLSAVVKGGKQDCVYSRKLCAAVYLWRGAVHAAKSVGLCIVVVVSPPEEIECGHSGRVVVLANHRYDSSSAHLCTRL